MFSPEKKERSPASHHSATPRRGLLEFGAASSAWLIANIRHAPTNTPMAKKLINPERLYDGSPFGLSQAVVDSESSLVFVSGQVDWNHQYQVTHPTVAGQFEAALENLRTALSAAGASVDSLLHLRLYVRGELEDHMESLAPILSRFLGSSRMAVTGIGVASLASKATLVEVEAVARAVNNV